MEEKNTKKGRVIINIERRTLKIILWLNFILFIGFFILGFFIGNISKSKKEQNKEIVKEENISNEEDRKNEIIKNEKIKNEEAIKEEQAQKKNEIKEETKVETKSQETNQKTIKKKVQIKNEKLPEKIVVETKNKKEHSIKEKLYTIQVMSLKDKSEAENIVKSLKNFGCDARVNEKKLSSGIWYRVRIGNYKTKEEAHREGKRLEENGIIKSFWVSESE